MPSRHLRLAAVLSLALSTATLAQAPLPRSLITQGGFDGTLDGWERAHGTVELDAEAGHDAAGSAKLTDGSKLQTPLIPYTHPFVRVELWMKTEGVERGPEPWNQAGGQVVWYDAERNELGHRDIGLTVGTTDWTRHGAELFWEEKEGVAFFRVCLMLWDAKGTAWFDDVTVEATEPPDAFLKVPLLGQVENDQPRIWSVPPLLDAEGAVDMGPIEVNFTRKRDFMIQPADPAAPTVSRLDVSMAGVPEDMGYTEVGWEAQTGWHYRYKSLMESETGYPALEVYGEAFRGSPIVSCFMRLYMLAESKVGQFKVSFSIPAEYDQLTWFWGAEPRTESVAERAPILRMGATIKPFLVYHNAEDTAGIVIYHPIPAEVRRWHIEDYIIEQQREIICRADDDGEDTVLSWDFRDIEAGAGGFEHSFDFTMFLMPYTGTVSDALKEFRAESDVDLMGNYRPLRADAPDGYWTEWMPRQGGARLLAMARYHPREFASWIPGSGESYCYGHGDGHMWGAMTAQMKGIRVDPLAEGALARDHAFRMLHFFLERMGERGAPPGLATSRALASRLPDPEDYYSHVFCQFWEFRMGELRALMQSPHLTEAEKEEAYLRLQLAKDVFDPENPLTWTDALPDDAGHWFKYMAPVIWTQNQWVINTHATSVGVAGEFALLAQETGHPEDEAWWEGVFKRGVDGLLYAMGQEWMWYGDEHDKDELRYARLQGGRRDYHSYMATAWLPAIIRPAIEFGDYRVDELLAYQQRLMQAKFMQSAEKEKKIVSDFLESIGRGDQ